MSAILLPDFVPDDFTNEWRDIPERDYHTDLSAVARGDILSFRKSGKAFLARRGQEQDEDAELSDPMRIGRATHMLALEPQRFKETYVVMPDFVGYTKDGKESANSKEARDKRASWKAEQKPGSEFVTAEELTHLIGMCDALLLHPQAKEMFEGGILEKCGYYRDPITGLKCRIKPDCVSPSLNGLFDFKTARDVSYRKFGQACNDHRYDIQLVQYAAGAGIILGAKLDILGWVAVEKRPPYEVAVWIMGPQTLERAERHCRKALDGIAEAVHTNKFEFRQKEAEILEFPQYCFFEEE